MKKYIALLRGINISGKNKIVMSELKEGFVDAGFADAVTYLNSGNVVFSSDKTDVNDIAIIIESMIAEKFALDIPVFVIGADMLHDALHNAPEWWGTDDKDIYDNVIFILPPLTYDDVYKEIGDANPKNEKIFNYGNVIFWSFVRKEYPKTNWIKTASSSINDKVTIRTANTLRKLSELSHKTI